MQRQPIARGIVTALAVLVAANALARLLLPWSTPHGVAYAEVWEYAREVLHTDVTTERREFLRSASSVAAALELVIGFAIVWGVRVRAAILVLGLAVVAFGVFILIAARSGWPIADCGCIAGASQLSVRGHLVINGLIGLTCAWAYHAIPVSAPSSSGSSGRPVTRAT